MPTVSLWCPFMAVTAKAGAWTEGGKIEQMKESEVERPGKFVTLLICILGLFIPAGVGNAETPPEIGWIRQFGTSGYDVAHDVAVNAVGSAYTCGATSGSLDGAYEGLTNAFVRNYDTTDNLLWSCQFGTAQGDSARSVVTDGLGNLYVTGSTFGNLDGTNASAEANVYLREYDSAGTVCWGTQMGSEGSDQVADLAQDASGDLYVGGYTYGAFDVPNAGYKDVFLRKYDSSGILAWTRQLGGNENDTVQDLATDGSGNIYVAGRSSSYKLDGVYLNGSEDAFLAKYDSAGDLLWTRRLGADNGDFRSDAGGVAVDSLGNAYIVGDTETDLFAPNSGGYSHRDIFLAKYSSDGSLVWGKQLGDEPSTTTGDFFMDNSGNFYIAGQKSRSTGSFSDSEVFLSKLDVAGDLLWTREFGTVGAHDYVNGLELDSSGIAYLAGTPYGGLSEVNAGDLDAYFASIPEPTSLALLCLSGSMLLRHRRK